MSTALFIDTFSRELRVSSVSVTQVAGHGMVIRFGVEVGSLDNLVSTTGTFVANVPLIVTTRGYAARSSSGFVRFVGKPTDRWGYSHIVGVQGMPWMDHGIPLTLLRNPQEALSFSKGVAIATLKTHAGKPGEGWGWHSNPNTAAAAVNGVELVAALRPDALFLIEGQSDYVRGWEFTIPPIDDPYPVFPEEHQGWLAERLAS